MQYLILPVHRNFKDCQNFIRTTSKKFAKEKLTFVVVNTNSKKLKLGREDFKKHEKHGIEIVDGKSDWYWYACVIRGLKKIESKILKDDVIIIINVDVKITSKYFEEARKILNFDDDKIIGSQVRNLISGALVDSGPKLINDFQIENIDIENINYLDSSKIEYKVDVISGRGMIFSAKYVKYILKFRNLFIPHYYSDYYLSIMLEAVGGKLVMSKKVFLYSQEDFGNKNVDYSPINLLFSKRNPQRFISNILFYSKLKNLKTESRSFSISLKFWIGFSNYIYSKIIEKYFRKN